MPEIKNALTLIGSCVIYSLLVALIDLIIVFVFTQDLANLASGLSFIMLIEGGLGLISGGVAASYTPIFSKMGEVIFHAEPWNAKRQKNVEKQAQVLILVGLFLLLLALLVSTI